MRIIAPYEINKAHANDTLEINIEYKDKQIYLLFINSKLDYINNKIKEFSLTSDIEKALFSKETKYRRYRKLLSAIRDTLEESLLTKEEEIIFTYEKFSIFYAAVISEYSKLLSDIDKWGYSIIDQNMAIQIQTILKNKKDLDNYINTVDNALFPKYNKFIDDLEEKYCIIDNDDSFPLQDEIDEEDATVDIFIHEYEIEYLMEYLIFFKELIEKKPTDKVFDTLKLYVDEGKYIYIDKEYQLTLIDKILKEIEKWKPGDRIIKLTPSEYILFALLIKGFYKKMTKKYEDYTLNLSPVEQNFVITSFIQTRLFLPYNHPIDGYKEPIFNRYFYDK